MRAITQTQAYMTCGMGLRTSSRRTVNAVRNSRPVGQQQRGRTMCCKYEALVARERSAAPDNCMHTRSGLHTRSIKS
eukprot:353336-Chlamydomonas_euryale.AAC.4